ncbi:MAG: hypothetical protein M1828_001362 [Chrysothrix sp. TS-e1954]|nr:MAG: hypothetical protein M1828_001362 [Chrysothrix sp. TS-e1954]
MTPPFIALEEHYYSEAIFKSLDDKSRRTLQAVPGVVSKLREVRDERLAAMDSGHIALQVISHAFAPGSPSAEACQTGNDELAEAIARSGQTSRFAAFAVLPVANAAESARELERSVRSLGFVGALVDNHANGKHFDSPAYDALWAKACELDVPIYLHPTWPSESAAETFRGSYPEPIGINLGGPGWGWHGDVGLHILKLFCANVFDRFPALKIIIGHMGEMIPFMLERCCGMSTRSVSGWGPHQRPLRQVWDENIWITTCILENTKVERIMYSVDYPFESNDKGREWFEELEASGLLTAEQLKMVAYRNAESLLKIHAGND